MDFRSAAELGELCARQEIPVSEAMLRRETALTNVSREQAIESMLKSWRIMRDSARRSIHSPVKSMGGLIGGEAAKMAAHREAGRPVCGGMLSKAAAYAVGMLEINASMGLIVAAPTAGSCGVIPGVFLAAQEEFELDDSRMVEGLFHAAAIGYLLMRNATVAGAQGGCQAEVGSASAMAAAALVELMGGGVDVAFVAASSALSNLMGLVCDPVAGLVEVPCQKRNAVGVANALVCAEMALSGIGEIIPLDEMIDSMARVGARLPAELRETALGGVAATPTGCRLWQRIKQEDAPPEKSG